MTPQEAIENAKRRQAIANAKARRSSQVDIGQGLGSVQESFDSSMDAARTMGSGVVGSIVGGLSGVGNMLNPFSDTSSGDMVRYWQDKLTIPPETEGGQQILEKAAEVMEPVEELRQYLGDRGYDLAGPIGGAIGQAELDALMMIGGLNVIRKSPSVKKTAIKTRIESGDVGKSAAKYKIQGGKVVIDPLYKNAAKNGVRENFIGAYKKATPRTKVKLRQILKKQKELLESGLSDARPADIAGDSLVARVRHLRNVNQKAGKRIDLIAKTILKDKNVDISPAYQTFKKTLDDMGVTSDGGKLVFDGSEIQGNALSKVQNLISEVNNMVNTGKANALSVHRMKRYIDSIVSYGKTQEGLSGRAEGVLKGLRASLDKVLDNSFPQYDKANIVYADTIGAINALQDSLGSKIDLSSSPQLAQKLRSLTNNTVTRNRLIPALKQVEATDAKYGATFTDDIRTQMEFVNELDAIFGTPASTSLQAEVAKGAGQMAIGEKITGAKTILGGLAPKKSPEAALKALEELIR